MWHIAGGATDSPAADSLKKPSATQLRVQSDAIRAILGRPIITFNMKNQQKAFNVSVSLPEK